MKEQFITINFSASSRAMIEKVNGILSQYRRQGYRLSLRQLYYQLVSRDLIPNNLQSYKRLGDLVSNGRLAGLIDWYMIEDRGRERLLNSHWDAPADIIRSAANGYAIDKWARQPNHIEVMVEKDALSGVLWPVCSARDIGFTANRGYSSSSAMYEAGKRIEDAITAGKQVYILYLGDHDPSGIDMTRDVRERLELFSRSAITVERLALNMDQVNRYNPPENPAKLTDSRAQAYIREFGHSSWELDALEPTVLAVLINNEIDSLIDLGRWQEDVEREKSEQEKLKAISSRYDEVLEALGLDYD